MIAERARVVSIAYAVTDMVMTSAALLVAHTVRGYLGTSLSDEWLGPVYPVERYLPLLLFILPTWWVVFSAVGLYGRRAARPMRTELSRLLKAITVCALLLAFAIFALRLVFVSRPVILLFLLLNGPLIELGRGLVRRFILDTSPRRHVLVAGAQQDVLEAVSNLDKHQDWGVEVVGLIGDGAWDDSSPSPHELLGEFTDIPTIVQQRVVDEVIVVPSRSQLDQLKELEPIFLQLEELGIVFRVLVNFLPGTVSNISFDAVGPMPMLTFSTAPRDELLLLVRRGVDIVLASVALVLLSPLFLMIGAAIGLTSSGPVLFRQIRCGLNGRPFVFLKFRSMRIDADELKPSLAAYNEMDGPAFKMKRDPRVTSLGRLLRRTSFDELPQLWNILKGDMSFVGPRPAVVEEVERYEPWQRRRLSMKPGLTCLWQVSGRNELTFDEWMRLDLEYIDNWSLWLDVKIALKTIPAVLLGRGAR